MSDWRTTAACRNEDPELFFPLRTDGPTAIQVEQAKAVCRGCPSANTCLKYALTNGIDHGVWGGLTEDERKTLRRSTRRRARTQPLQAPTTKLPPPTTLEEAFNRRAHHTTDGHVTWQGTVIFKFRAVRYNALRVAFALGHGREPEGPVDRLCDEVCFAADHLIDSVLRASGVLCGTRRGYYWHHRAGEPACGPCRQANTDADNRLRRTGTSKAAA